MAYEDFTTYNETDPNNHITVVDANSIDAQVNRQETAYVSKDKGSGHFTDFEHLFRTVGHNLLSAFGNDISYVYGLLDSLTDYKTLRDNLDIGIGCFFYDMENIGAHTFRLNEIENGNYFSDDYTYTIDQTIYCKVTKSGTTLTCHIYSDASRTILLDTLSLTLQADHSFQYVTPINTYNSGDSHRGDVETFDLDLQETTTTTDKNIPTYFNSKFITHH